MSFRWERLEIENAANQNGWHKTSDERWTFACWTFACWTFACWTSFTHSYLLSVLYRDAIEPASKTIV